MLDRLPEPVEIEAVTDSSNRGSYLTVCGRTTKFQRIQDVHCRFVFSFKAVFYILKEERLRSFKFLDEHLQTLGAQPHADLGSVLRAFAQNIDRFGYSTVS